MRCFERAVDADPDCAMAHWGIAYAAGPNYNKEWDAFDPDELIERSRCACGATRPGARAARPARRPVERALIEALRGALPGGRLRR